MTVQELETDRANKIYWLGNMILLTTALNTSLRNYVFEKKILGEGRKKGIKDYDDLSITKDIVNQFDSGDKVWNEEHIIKRTNELGNEILQIW